MPLGALISAGASLLGGLLGKKSQEKAAAKGYAQQKEFAQHGIRWRVADAQAAGIHPLAALGVPLQQVSPIAVGDTMGSAFASAGQDIGRAIDAKRTAGERVDAVTKTMRDLQLQRMGLENELLAAKIAVTRQAGQPPAMPGALVEDEPLRRVVGLPGQEHQEPGGISDVGYVRSRYGGAIVPSYDVKQRIEDQMLPEFQWFIRNNILPWFTGKAPVGLDEPEGMRFVGVNPLTGVPIYRRVMWYDRPRRYGGR